MLLICIVCYNVNIKKIEVTINEYSDSKKPPVRATRNQSSGVAETTLKPLKQPYAYLISIVKPLLRKRCASRLYMAEKIY